MIPFRRSKPRDTILNLMLASDRPLDKEEVFLRSRALVPTLGRSTVYRVMRELHEAGIVRPLVGPAHKVYFESAAPPTHHHSFCRRCQRAFCLHARLDVQHMVPAHFTLEEEVLYLFGVCRECQ